MIFALVIYAVLLALACLVGLALCRAAAAGDRMNEKAPREGRGAIPSAAGYRLPGDFDVPGRLPARPAGGKRA